jgi:hypothetical protein
MAATVALVYEIALNTFLLAGGLGRVLSRDPDSLLVAYGSGWSILPGWVHAHALRIRSKDSHIEFDLRIDRCTFRVALFDLLRRRFHVTTVSGEGISFVARRRLDPSDATPDTLDALPPIEGLEPVPLRGPATQPPDEAHYDLVTFELDRVDAKSVREIWFDTLRFEGVAHITGGFFLRPIRWASVGPVSTEVRAGRIEEGKDVVASEVRGRIETTVDGLDPRVTEGPQLLRHTSMRASLEGQVPRLASLQRWIPRAEVAIRQGSGYARIDIRADHGRLGPDSRAEADVRAAQFASSPASLTGDLHVSAAIMASDENVTLEGVATARGVRLAVGDFETAPIRIEQAELRLQSAQLDLADHPFSDATIQARIPSAQIADMRFVDSWLSKTSALRVEGGRGTFGAELDIAPSAAHGRAILALDDARVSRGNDEYVLGHLMTRVELPRWDLKTGRMDLSGTRVEIRKMSATGGTENWWANADVPASRFDLRGGLSWRADVAIEARDTRPLMSALVTTSGLPQWVAPVISTRDLHATARVLVSDGARAIDISDLQATAGPLRLRATLSKRGETSRLLAVISNSDAAVGVEKIDGDTRVQLVDASTWYEARRCQATPPPERSPVCLGRQTSH